MICLPVVHKILTTNICNMTWVQTNHLLFGDDSLELDGLPDDSPPEQLKYNQIYIYLGDVSFRALTEMVLLNWFLWRLKGLKISFLIVGWFLKKTYSPVGGGIASRHSKT